MADGTASPNAVQPSKPPDVAGVLARWMVRGGLIYIAVISLLALVGTFAGPENRLEEVTAQWKDILTFTLPVLGAWVGTVLAFYFSKENFEAANRSMQSIVGHLSAPESSSKGFPSSRSWSLGPRSWRSSFPQARAKRRSH